MCSVSQGSDCNTQSAMWGHISQVVEIYRPVRSRRRDVRTHPPQGLVLGEQRQQCLNTNRPVRTICQAWEREPDLRALSCTVGRARTLSEQLYFSKAAECGVRISTTMWPVLGSGTPNPGKSSSSRSTAARRACASACTAPLQPSQHVSHQTNTANTTIDLCLSRMHVADVNHNAITGL